MPTAPTPPTALPTAPDPGDRATFNARAYPWSAALPTFGAQLTAVANNVVANATEAALSATTAAGSATASGASAAASAASAAGAAASAASAAAGAGVGPWVSGTTYTVGACVYSPINYFTYRRKTTGAGTTDPSLDSTNWGLAVPVQTPVPLGGAIWLNNRTVTGNTYVQDGYTYLRTGVLALKSAFPNYPSTYNLLVPAGLTLPIPRQIEVHWGIKSLALGNSLALMTSNTGGVARSADGLTWTTVATSCYQGITFGAGLFVIYGIGIGNGNGPQAFVQTTTDGVTFTNRTMPSSQRWAVSDYANGKFIAVDTLAAGTATATSADGITWTAGGATPAHTGGWTPPLRVGSAWVIKDQYTSGTARAYSLDNGATWLLGNVPSVTTNGYRKATNGAVLIDTGVANTTSYEYTLDGVTWANGAFPVSAVWQLLPSISGVFFAKAASSTSQNAVGVIYYSSNGTTWTSTGQPGTTLFKIGANYYLILTATTSKMSADLLSWTACDGFAQVLEANPRASYEIFNGRLLTICSAETNATPIAVHEYQTLYTGESVAATNGNFTAYVRAT